MDKIDRQTVCLLTGRVCGRGAHQPTAWGHNARGTVCLLSGRVCGRGAHHGNIAVVTRRRPLRLQLRKIGFDHLPKLLQEARRRFLLALGDNLSAPPFRGALLQKKPDRPRFGRHTFIHRNGLLHLALRLRRFFRALYRYGHLPTYSVYVRFNIKPLRDAGTRLIKAQPVASRLRGTQCLDLADSDLLTLAENFL